MQVDYAKVNIRALNYQSIHLKLKVVMDKTWFKLYQTHEKGQTDPSISTGEYQSLAVPELRFGLTVHVGVNDRLQQ